MSARAGSDAARALAGLTAGLGSWELAAGAPALGSGGLGGLGLTFGGLGGLGLAAHGLSGMGLVDGGAHA